MYRYRKTIAAFMAVALVAFAAQVTLAVGFGHGHGSRCSQCGCEAECQKVCKKVCTTKTVTMTCWDVKCKDICLAGKLDRCDCDRCTCGPEAPCGEVRTKKVLMKKMTRVYVKEHF